MYQLVCGEYSIQVEDGGLPEIYAEYSSRAVLKIEKDLKSSEGKAAFCAVARDRDWPFLAIAFRYSPSGSGFSPGLVLVPETDLLFLGAGTLLLAFDLRIPCQLWEDSAEVGFLSWSRHAEVVVMSAELELAAWDLNGRKLWTKNVEPPWDYTVENGLVKLDVMGEVSEFSLDDGPNGT